MFLPNDSILRLRIYPLKVAGRTWLVCRYKFWHFSHASVERPLYTCRAVLFVTAGELHDGHKISLLASFLHRMSLSYPRAIVLSLYGLGGVSLPLPSHQKSHVAWPSSIAAGIPRFFAVISSETCGNCWHLEFLDSLWLQLSVPCCNKIQLIR